jgi:pilus assembly protein Flp/PilA
MKALIFLIHHEQAQGLSEYGIVLGVISIGVIGLVAGLSENILSMLSNTLEILMGREG